MPLHRRYWPAVLISIEGRATEAGLTSSKKVSNEDILLKSKSENIIGRIKKSSLEIF